MTGRTHTLLGTAAGLSLAVVLQVEPLQALALAGCAAFGGLLPDVDAQGATLNRKLPPLRVIAWILPHRTVTHSLAALCILTLAALHYLHPMILGYALSAGYGAHILADSLTCAGVPLLWPYRGKFWLLPRVLAIRTGGRSERFIAFLGALLVLYLFQQIFR